MNKIKVPVSKPRNPLVTLARGRKAGAHASLRERLEKILEKERRAERF